VLIAVIGIIILLRLKNSNSKKDVTKPQPDARDPQDYVAPGEDNDVSWTSDEDTDDNTGPDTNNFPDYAVPSGVLPDSNIITQTPDEDTGIQNNVLPPSPSSSPIVPLLSSFIAQSLPQDAGVQSAGGVPPYDNIYLDRHRIACPVGSALNMLQMRKYPGDNTISYQFLCTSTEGNAAKVKAPSNPKQTAPDDRGDPYNGIINLSRHNVKCDDNQVLTDFKFIRPSDDKIQYNYGCASPDTTTSRTTCRDVSTPMTAKSGDKVSMLDLADHKLQCNSDEAIGRFQFVRGPDDNTIGYSYSCCKVIP